MRAESRIPPRHWIAGALVALTLHVGLLLTLGPGLHVLSSPAGSRAGGPAGLRISLEDAFGAPSPRHRAHDPSKDDAPTGTPARVASPAPPARAAALDRAPAPPAPRREAPLAAAPAIPVDVDTTTSRPAPPTTVPPARAGEAASVAGSPPERTAETSESEGPDVAAGPALAALGAGSGAGAAGSGASDAVGTGAGGAARDDYFDALFARVVSTLEYPRRARLEGIEGTVVLRLRLDRDGRIDGMEVAESSGSPLLDRQAMRIVRRAAPFGSPPPSLADASLSFELPLEFALTD